MTTFNPNTHPHLFATHIHIYSQHISTFIHNTYPHLFATHIHIYSQHISTHTYNLVRTGLYVVCNHMAGFEYFIVNCISDNMRIFRLSFIGLWNSIETFTITPEKTRYHKLILPVAPPLQEASLLTSVGKEQHFIHYLSSMIQVHENLCGEKSVTDRKLPT